MVSFFLLLGSYEGTTCSKHTRVGRLLFLRVVHVGAPCLQQPQEERRAGVPISAFLTLKMPKLILPRALTPSHLVSMAQKQRRVGEAWEWGGGRGGVSTISRGRGQVCIAGGAGERKGLDSRRTQAGTGHVLWGGGRQGARGRGCKVCVQNALQCPFWQGSPCRTFRNVRFQASKPTMFSACCFLYLSFACSACCPPARVATSAFLEHLAREPPNKGQKGTTWRFMGLTKYSYKYLNWGYKSLQV